jgi:hypothetical protein
VQLFRRRRRIRRDDATLAPLRSRSGNFSNRLRAGLEEQGSALRLGDKRMRGRRGQASGFVQIHATPRAASGLNHNASKRIALVVLGMHRSGTSAITRVLSLLGAALPKHPMLSKTEQDHWEPVRLVHVHDAMLEEAGSLGTTGGASIRTVSETGSIITEA